MRPGLFGELTERDLSEQAQNWWASERARASGAGGSCTADGASDTATDTASRQQSCAERGSDERSGNRAEGAAAAPQTFQLDKAAYGDVVEKLSEAEQTDGRSKVFWCVVVSGVVLLVLAAVVTLVLLLVVLAAGDDNSSNSSVHNTSVHNTSTSDYCSQHHCNTTAFRYQFAEIPLNDFRTTRVTTAFIWSVANLTFSRNQNVEISSFENLQSSGSRRQLRDDGTVVRFSVTAKDVGMLDPRNLTAATIFGKVFAYHLELLGNNHS